MVKLWYRFPVFLVDRPDGPVMSRWGVGMQGLVFIYDEKRSVINRLFTIRIEDRKKKGKLWVPAGPKRYYTAGELQRSGAKIIDRTLFSMAFKSETDIRKLEGRFFSADAEYTIYRISPYDLKAFLDQCFCSEVLCTNEGRPVHFNYVGHTIPQIAFTDTGDGFAATVSLQGRAVDALGYEMVSDPVRIVSGTSVYELVRGLPVSVIKQLISGSIIPYHKYDAMLKALSKYAGKLDLEIPDKKRKRIISHVVPTPVLDIHGSFRFANLSFKYADFGPYAMGDERRIIFNHKKNIELHRDFRHEHRFRNRLEKYGAIYRGSDRGEWFIPEGKREAMLHELEKDGWLLTLSGKPLILDIKLAWDIEVRDRKLLVGGTVRYGEDSTDMENILDAYLSKQLWFDLPGGYRGHIPKHLSVDFEQLELRGDFRDTEISFEPYDFSFVAKVFSDKKNVIQGRKFGEYLSFLEAMGDLKSSTEIPTSLKAQLRSYQKLGFSWLTGLVRFGFGGVLADDMGLGKTLQVLTLLLHLKEKSAQPHLTLLVVPKTLVWNWVSEIQSFAPSLQMKTHIGPGRRDTAFSELSGVDLVITSYGLVRQDIDLMGRVSWDLLVLDEGQAIKNPTAKISKAVRKLTASIRIVLTGTPIENRPLDLWSLFDFLMPGFLGEKEAFKSTYEQQGRDSLNSLGTLTAPFILRRMKKQVCTELPLKTEITLFCDFSAEQKVRYDEILTAGKDQAFGQSDPDPSGGSPSVRILTLLLRLRQTACHPSLVSGAPPYHGSSGKFEAILETALEILEGGYKILIFSQFVAHLELVKEMFDQHGVEHHSLYGSTTQRSAVIDRFKGSQNPCVFLISLKTGGVGLNLTEAGYVFLLDPWWNPATENQAIDRSHRIGQENPVTVYRFITKNSVEENVNRLKESKRQIEKAVLEQGDWQNIQFSEQELLALIE
jgi:superfamily II DNA or RNA helicase